MDTKASHKTKSRNYWLWLAVALLVILILVTWALLAAIMKNVSGTPRDVIALTSQESGKTVYQTLYRPVDGEGGAVTRDERAEWTSQTDIDLFQSSYTGTGRNITVSAENGDKLIAPGTTNRYAFSVQNTGNLALSYSVTLRSVLDAENPNISMEYRLRRGNAWLIGDETHWATSAELNAAEEKADLYPDKSDPFLLEWRWKFEGSDEEDTALAAIASGRSDAFSLTISTTAEAIPTAAAVNGAGELLYKRVIGPKEIALAVLDLALLAGLLLLLLGRRSVYVTGFVRGVENGELSCGRRHSGIHADGRFVFPRVYTGKRRFALGDARLDCRLKRRKDVEGIRFEEADNGTPVVAIGQDIRAVELFLVPEDGELTFTPSRWAAIDRKNIVYTPDGIQEPGEDGGNETPDGLKTDRNRNYSFAEKELATL